MPNVPDIELAKPPPNPTPKPPLSQRLKFPDQPSAKTFFRLCWLDILTQLLCTAAAFLLYRFVPSLPAKYIPVFPGMATSAIGLKIGKPYLKEFVSTLVSAIVSFVGPLVVMLLISAARVRSFWDCNSAIMGLGYALSTTTLFQSILKIFIGGLRPHFLTVCLPAMHPVLPGTGYTHIWHKPDSICTGNPKHIREAQMSFPSGHSAAAFAGFGFLALYLNAKFKVLSGLTTDHIETSKPTDITHQDLTALSHSDKSLSGSEKPLGNGTVAKSAQTSHWKLLLFVLPWLIAACIAASKVMDYWHHPTDCIAGALLGIAAAHMAYRMVYKSVYDGRKNHIPRLY